MKRILLVEDDANLGTIIQDSLEMHGYDVTLKVNGKEALDAFVSTTFDICLFDVMLPKMDGLSLAKEIRKTNSHIPILFLTSKSLKEDKIAGFLAGGDDYITKPFHIDELLHRLQVFLKRSQTIGATVGITHIGPVTWEPHTMQLRVKSRMVQLTQKEAAVLLILYQNQPAVVERKTILLEIWGDDDYFMGRSLDVYISKLRKYLSDTPEVQIINVHGIGFRMVVEEKAK